MELIAAKRLSSDGREASEELLQAITGSTWALLQHFRYNAECAIRLSLKR